MRVLIADDHREVRSGLKILFEQEDYINVVGEVEDIDELLVQVNEVRPEILLMDWELPNLQRTDIIPKLRSVCPGLKIIVLSGRPESKKEALKAGANAFVSKGDQPEILLKAVNEV